MKIKKLTFLLVLLFSMVQTVFAVEEGAFVAPGMDIAIMTIEEPAIEVVVPAKKKLYINPLGFPVDMGSYTDNSQIVMEPACIENKGDTRLAVSVSVIGSVDDGSTMTLTTLPTKDTGSTKKKAFIYFEIQAVSDPDHVTWAETYDSLKHVPVRTILKKRRNIVELDAADGEKPYGAYRLTGDCIARPTIPWTAEDGIQAVVAFTFEPIVTIS